MTLPIAIAHRRVEPADSPQFFPTPPWATRALFHHVLGRRGFGPLTAEEPACGEGHMSYVLEEYFGTVRASDLHDYGIGAELRDFLDAEAWAGIERPDWIISNPPFGDVALPFVVQALRRARAGVAMFLRTTQLEGINRYRHIYRPYRPAIVAHFVERVPLHKGRWEPEGDTQTAYSWFVWRLDTQVTRTDTVWIPPVCRGTLHFARDVERFGAVA